MVEAGTISVVVCAYTERRWASLRAALESIRAQRTPPLETIVVADHNPALQRAITAAYPDVMTVANCRSRGLSGARNTGVRCAGGTIVAFLDDDAVAEPDWLSRMSAHYFDPAIIGVGGRVLPQWPAQKPRWFPEEFYWVVGCSYRGQPEHLAPVRNPIGGNMSFKRAVIERLDGFRESIGREGANGSGCEETEFCIRAQEAYPQSKILYDPYMIVHHRLEPERATWRYFRTRCRAEGRSKALVVRHVGSGRGLSSERSYSLRVLPHGVMGGLRDSTVNSDIAGLARAGAILCGLAYTASSYFGARLVRQSSTRASEQPFQPLRIMDVDLASPIPAAHSRRSSKDLGYARAFCLLRFAGRPVGIAETTLDKEGQLPADLGAIVTSVHRHSSFDASAPSARSGEAPFVSVVIATRDRPARLAACLDSLLSQDYRCFDVVVVDNAPSSQETAELIASRYASTGQVRYLLEEIPGLGRAHNTGLATVTAPIVAFTDDDVIVDQHWLTALASNFATNDNAACVTGLILPAELDTRAQYWAERHGGFGKGFERKSYDLEEHRTPGRLFPYAAGQFGSGANMAFRTDALRRIGGFDPALGAGTQARGGDDLAAFFQVVQAGYQLVYEPAAIVWHHHRRDESGMRRQAFGYGVGLGAYLTKLILDQPDSLRQLLSALPEAFVHLFGASSAKNKRLAEDYPASLVWRERIGILAGVPLYLISRASSGRKINPRIAIGSDIFSPASVRRR
jgi:GT2 family glycosyltransferase